MDLVFKKEQDKGETSYTKEDVDSRVPVQVLAYSNSQLGMAQRCPRQIYFRYVLGFKIPPSGSMVIGRGVHKGAELSLKHLQKKGKLLPGADVREIAAEATRSEFQKGPTSDDESEAVLVDDSVKMVTVWSDKVAPKKKPFLPGGVMSLVAKSYDKKVKYRDLKVELLGEDEEEETSDSDRKANEPFTGIETGFTINLPGVKKPVTGWIDLLELLNQKKMGVDITDHKTSQNRKNQNDMRSMQLLLYGIVAKMMGLTPVNFNLDVMLRPKPRTPAGDFQPLTLVAPTDDVAYRHVVSAFIGLEKIYEEGLFPPSYGIQCGWCGYRKLCDQVSSVKTFVV